MAGGHLVRWNCIQVLHQHVRVSLGSNWSSVKFHAVVFSSFYRHVTCTRYNTELDWGTSNSLFWKMHVPQAYQEYLLRDFVVLEYLLKHLDLLSRRWCCWSCSPCKNHSQSNSSCAIIRLGWTILLCKGVKGSIWASSKDRSDGAPSSCQLCCWRSG